MCFLFLVNSNLSSYQLLVFRLVLVRYNNLDGLGFYSPSCSILEQYLWCGGYIVFPGEEVVGECYYKRGHSKSELQFLRSIVTKSRVIYMSAGLIL